MTGNGLVRTATEPRAEIGPQGAGVLLSCMEAARHWWSRNGSAPPARFDEVFAELAKVVVSGGMHPMPIRRPAVESAAVYEDPITPTQAAFLLGITPRGARDLCARGTLATAQRRPGGWIIERSEVLDRAASCSA